MLSLPVWWMQLSVQLEIQKELKNRNADLPENRKMEFRIGVNLGDVIEDGEQILGDGVNIAARLEGLAEAGGICISGTAYDHVENKLSLGYEYLGEQSVKNIAKAGASVSSPDGDLGLWLRRVLRGCFQREDGASLT